MLTASAAAAGHAWGDWASAAGRHDTVRQILRAADALDGTAGSLPLATTTPLITFVEPDESFFSQSIRGFALTLVTLGFYSFWARAEARRQLHRAVRVGGHPLDYTGTGGEALVAFIVGTMTTVILVSCFLYFFIRSGAGADQVRAALSDFRLRRLFISLPMLFLLGSVAYRKRKHMLRRTWWRGQHFDLDGQPWGYAWQHLWTALLMPLTLGWAAPWRANHLERRKINDMHHGPLRFRAAGSVAPLYRAFAVLWFGGGTLYVATMVLLGLTIGEPLLAAVSARSLAPLSAPGVSATGLIVLGVGLVPVIGFVLTYRAAWLEHKFSSLTFDGVRLRLRLPKLRFGVLMVWAGFVKLISFGALQPYANAAVVRFIVARIRAVPLDQRV